MKVSLKIQGGMDLARHLKALPEALSRKVQVEALKDGAEPMREMATDLAPRGAGPGPHLADNIVVGAPTQASLERRGRFDETVVEVGPSRKPNDVFYGFFQEFGTRHHAAQPFMRPAFDSQAGHSLTRILSSFWRVIKRALPTVGRAA